MQPKLMAAVLMLFSIIPAMAQEKLWTKQSKVSDAITFEKGLDPHVKFLSQNVTLSKDYYPLADKYKTVNPVIAQRKPAGYLPVYAEYFFTPQDSVLRLISYDWEKDRHGNFFDKQKIWEEESTKFDTYNKEYERIKKILLAQLGKPTSTDTEAKTVSSNGTDYYIRETLWETEALYAELNMTFHPMTYRVRLTMYWKK